MDGDMLDDDGYPTEEALKRIREWQPHPDAGFTGFFSDFIKGVWWHPDWGIANRGNRYWVSTGGWSGNEDVIGAMQENFLLWSMCWESSRRGGHYVFRAWRPKKGDR